MGWSIQPASQADIPALADIHYSSLPEDYLPSLGKDFLQKVYYSSAIRSQYASTLIAFQNETPVGFSTIAYDSPAFTRKILIDHSIALLKYALRAAVQKPAHLRLSIEVFLKSILSAQDLVPGEIVFIAVRSGFRDQGLGKILVERSLAYLVDHANEFCRTKTLAENQSVIGMYLKLGWRIREEYQFIGRKYVTLISPRLTGELKYFLASKL